MSMSRELGCIEQFPKYPLQFESHPIIHSDPFPSPTGGAGVGFCHAWVVNHHFSTYGAGVVYAGEPHRSESEPDWPLDPFLLFFFRSNLSDHLCVRQVWHFTFGFVHFHRFPWHYRKISGSLIYNQNDLYLALFWPTKRGLNSLL